jgi:hypothetical protein
VRIALRDASGVVIVVSSLLGQVRGGEAGRLVAAGCGVPLIMFC